MKPGTASRTAVLVCAGRAIAHGQAQVARFDDPTALLLLPDAARAEVARFLAGTPPRGIRARLRRAYLDRQSKLMAARTVAIDDAVRQAAAPQLVILGAGLDGRAWRMGELAGATVFEVDHPDTQRDKRLRAAGLVQRAGEVRFVAVDFARDLLEDALRAAGHDPSQPTTWVWEGVVMYLERAAIETTLTVVERRSAANSRMIVLYHSPAAILWVVGAVVRMMGEPLRSVFTEAAMRKLLASYRLGVVRDRSIRELGAELGGVVAASTRPMTHLRLAVADRA